MADPAKQEIKLSFIVLFCSNIYFLCPPRSYGQIFRVSSPKSLSVCLRGDVSKSAICMIRLRISLCNFL